MKKILAIFIIATLLFACKKDDPKPAPAPAATTTTPADPKWNYSYNYKKSGDNTEYQADECLTPNEMATKQQLVGAYNIQQRGRCN